jgi:hypothetical protein
MGRIPLDSSEKRAILVAVSGFQRAIPTLASISTSLRIKELRRAEWPLVG